MTSYLKVGLAALPLMYGLCAAAGAVESVSPTMVGAIPAVAGVKTATGQVFTPTSSIASPGDAGRYAHTNYKIFAPAGGMPPVPAFPNVSADGATVTPATTYNAETPASIACVYHLVTVKNGCNYNKVFTNASGGSKVIVIVDAFHDPNALGDLQAFSTQFGLPAPNLQVIFCSATKCGVSQPPAVDAGWAGEISLDLQWAHAMAPHAKLILIEAKTNGYNNLFLADDEAGKRAAAAGGGQVSNSYGGGEFTGEQSYAPHYKHADVVYFASTGDTVGTEFPSVLPAVVAVGGTGILRNGNGGFTGEQAWYNSDSSSTGGGLSSQIARPTYQNAVSGVVGTHRGVPDVAADADPNSGVYVFCTPCGAPPPQAFVFGGTSLASPLVAAMTNAAGKFRASGGGELNAIYGGLGTAKFTDITQGGCNTGASVPAGSGYDLCTGVGTPKGLNGL